ncbi:glycosyltransferase family 2 protein [Rhizophagus irregularis DAOM 181602=DAOM 197198]|nr:glycosyltransferase family 2 protein [Rhizophagus irregularis DAOM 181602=DAOM 197198]
MNKFHKTYLEISIQKKVPCNFGCVTFTDITFPGFPAFPVISRVHLDTFNGDIIPQQKFQIQDVYTYLFQLYRRWGCSIILHDVEIQKIDVDQRYEKWYHSDWKFDVLNNSVDRVEKWLNNNNKTPIQKLLTLDIVVPSYRVDFKYLDPIINLEIPVTMSTIIYIIIDDPNSSNIILLKKLYEKDPFIRILVNKPNLGASLSRNRGLYESNADYILFLDDDVTPEKDILFECEKVIKEHPTACGFIGSSKFPPANESIFKSAVVLSGVTFFWEIAEIWDNDIPWGIAGNLLIRSYKDDILFDSSFPKTGGGEDIDFCLKKGNFFIKNVENGKGFQGAPNVKVTHHWWNDGKRYYWRFYKWAKGDGALIKMHPNLTYNDIVPNSAEFLLGTTFILFITVIISSLITVFYDIEIINIFTILIFLSVPHVIISNFIFDIHLHLIIQPFKRVPTIRGYRYILAIFESSMIRMTNEFGRLMGHIERKEWNYIGKRFDWFAKKNGGTMNDEISTNSRKFFIWVSLMVFSSSVLLIVISESPM